MIIINSIALVAAAAVLIYIVCFLCRYRVIPQSLSVTAEWSGRYYWWQCTICTVMGFLSYWIATVYPMNAGIVSIITHVQDIFHGTYPVYSKIHGYGMLSLLGCAGACGLALAGYYSYSPEKESRRLLTIHKVGSFSGAVLLILFYIIKSIIYKGEFIHWSFCACALGAALFLGFLIKGKRLMYQMEVADMFEGKAAMIDGTWKRYSQDHSIVFWMELAIIVIVSSDIINKFISVL